jgi:hypothetical protein
MSRKHILYLQLPLLDNDTPGPRENFPFAGAYLDHALKRSPEAPFYSSSCSPVEWDELDTHHLADAILATGADIIACTLYLWNIERTLRLATLLKEKKPGLKLIGGGPEVAKEHPLLFEQPLFDAVVTGEGEAVFPALLAAWRDGTPIDFNNLATFGSKGWKWGTDAPPSVGLADAQPGEEAIMQCVQNRPVVYLETVRGCPLTCSYCRYYQLHTGLRALTTGQVLQRIRRLRELGATEIRFVDPTFNARPGFTELLAALAKLNRGHQLSFFAEIRPDTLTGKQAKLMRAANFTAVEVGVQSIDPDVLRNVARPVRMEKTAAGIQVLCQAGVHVVLDLMYGLPGQTLTDVRQSLDWGLAFGDAVQVQCMQTLVLPGTVLRNNSKHWKFDFEALPPYGIKQTAHLPPDDIRDIEILLDEHPNLPADPVTPRFCGLRLAGLFRKQHRIRIDQLELPVPGQSNRRTLLICGADLFSHRAGIANLIDRAITAEPDGLWQFVLVPELEEPLDLIDELAAGIRRHPPHLLDRFASAAAFNLTVSRRLYVRTNPSISNDWKSAAEELLRESFG